MTFLPFTQSKPLCWVFMLYLFYSSFSSKNKRKLPISYCLLCLLWACIMFVFWFFAMFLFDMMIFKLFIPPLLNEFFDASSILLCNIIS